MAHHFLAQNPNAKIRYFVGNMQLAVDPNAAYLVIPGAKSQYAGHFYLKSHPYQKNYNKAALSALLAGLIKSELR